MLGPTFLAIALAASAVKTQAAPPHAPATIVSVGYAASKLGVWVYIPAHEVGSKLTLAIPRPVEVEGAATQLDALVCEIPPKTPRGWQVLPGCKLPDDVWFRDFGIVFSGSLEDVSAYACMRGGGFGWGELHQVPTILRNGQLAVEKVDPAAPQMRDEEDCSLGDTAKLTYSAMATTSPAGFKIQTAVLRYFGKRTQDEWTKTAELDLAKIPPPDDFFRVGGDQFLIATSRSDSKATPPGKVELFRWNEKGVEKVKDFPKPPPLVESEKSDSGSE